MTRYTIKYIQIGEGSDRVRVFHALVHASSPMAAARIWQDRFINIVVLSAEVAA